MVGYVQEGLSLRRENKMSRIGHYVLLSVSALILLTTFLIFSDSIRLQEKSKVRPVRSPETPDVDYDRPAKMSFSPKDHYFRFDQLDEAYRAPGEYTHRLDGERYGFESLSFIITDTQPNGGPNLHVHDFEEAHILLEGTAKYQMGDKTFSAEAPYVVKVPAGVPHTFINAGTKPFNLVAVFASKKLGSKRLGPNPLIRTEPKK
jgi:mannose-6-phosphate isomerase-like protein (cupin superfamily)